MTRSCHTVLLAVCLCTAAAWAHPGHEVSSVEHLVESPDHWLPLVLSAVLLSAVAIVAVKVWKSARRTERSAEVVCAEDRAE